MDRGMRNEGKRERALQRQRILKKVWDTYLTTYVVSNNGCNNNNNNNIKDINANIKQLCKGDFRAAASEM